MVRDFSFNQIPILIPPHGHGSGKLRGFCKYQNLKGQIRTIKIIIINIKFADNFLKVK